jgi:amidohydrolase
VVELARNLEIAFKMGDWRKAIDESVESRRGLLREVRRRLHASPEPSREEYQTTRFLAEQLEEAGISSAIAPTGRGVIAGPENANGGPVIAFRADIDALRIHDAKTVPYRSMRDGVMHACGHDAHAAMALGAALALWQCRDGLPEGIAWRAVFQPSEEVGEGAFEMIAAGAMTGVGAVIAVHVDPETAAGRLAYRQGVLTAFCQELQVEIRGVGGHAARPHQSVDPIGVASQFITSVYQFVPRSIDSRDPVVVTFGCIQGGTSSNIIPEQVLLKGTIRTLSEAAATRVGERIRQIAFGLSEASGANIGVQFRRGSDAVVNDPDVTRTCVRAAGEIVGQANLDEIPLPSMGGEDFSGYLKHAPGCLLRLGVAAPDRPGHFLHSPHFDIDEQALVIGAKVLAHSVVLLSESVRSKRS